MLYAGEADPARRARGSAWAEVANRLGQVLARAGEVDSRSLPATAQGLRQAGRGNAFLCPG